MTRKDYVLIASALKQAKEALDEDSYTHVVNAMANALISDNPAFDSRRFYEACR